MLIIRIHNNQFHKIEAGLNISLPITLNALSGEVSQIEAESSTSYPGCKNFLSVYAFISRDLAISRVVPLATGFLTIQMRR